MLSPVTLTLVYSISAGIINGSFALPTKYVKTWNFENIWLNYALWGFLIFPWLTVFFMDPQIGSIYRAMPMNTLYTLLIGGFLFGVGQVCFASALHTIGLGLGFLINIGLATGLGSLLPLLMLGLKNTYTPAVIITFIGVALIILGLLLSYSAGHKRDKEALLKQSITTNKPTKNNMYHLGVLLAIVAGIFSAGQNYTFALTGNMQQLALSSGANTLTASMIIWPPFLTCCLIPYALYMLYLHVKNNSFQKYNEKKFLQNSLLSIVMGFFAFGSLAIYSKASLTIGALGPVIAWPLFMILIILTSNFWSWRHNEWSGCSLAVKKRFVASILIFICAVLVLTYSASLTL